MPPGTFILSDNSNEKLLFFRGVAVLGFLGQKGDIVHLHDVIEVIHNFTVGGLVKVLLIVE